MQKSSIIKLDSLNEQARAVKKYDFLFIDYNNNNYIIYAKFGIFCSSCFLKIIITLGLVKLYLFTLFIDKHLTTSFKFSFVMVSDQYNIN